MTRGFLGGTFNPPHLGHTRAAAAAARQLGLDALYLIPTGEPPHKALPEDSAAAAQRLEMTRLAALELPCARVLDWELVRQGKSYTALTAERMLAEEPDSPVWLLCGGDMFLSLSEWYRADWLLQNLSVAAYPRRTGELEALRRAAAAYRARYGTAVRVLDAPPMEISSTALRALLRKGEGGQYLSGPVYAYILQNRLYGVRPQPSALWPLVRPWYAEARVPHIQGCRDEAVKLALRWGADPLDAENAAILHDAAKAKNTREQLRLCEKYGIICSRFEQDYESVLHAFSSAAVAWGLFGVSAAVRDAIMWHTTGKADMTVLEKVVWLADYIEPTRAFPGLEAVRKRAYEDLDGALRMALSATLEHLRKRGREIHPATREALGFLREESNE